MNADSFDIQRLIQFRNTPRPRIRGSVVVCGDGTRLVGSMSLTPELLALLGVWMAALTVMTVVSIYRVSTGTLPLVFALAPFLLFVFGYGLVVHGFRKEADTAERLLCELLQARPVPVGHAES